MLLWWPALNSGMLNRSLSWPLRISLRIHHNEKQPASQHERPAMRFNSSSCLSVVQKQKAPTG